MRKLFLLFSIIICSSVLYQANAQYKILWDKYADSSYTFFKNDNNTRGLAYNYATNHLLVASRTGGPNIIIIDPATGDSLGKMKMPSPTTGVYPINLPRATTTGQIITTGLVTGAGNLQLFSWQSETDTVPVTSVIPVQARTGDALAVTGSGANTVVYVSGSSSTKIYICTTADGSNFSLTDSIVVPAGSARGGIAPIVPGDKTSDVWINGAGTNCMLVKANGTITDTISGGVISGGWYNILYHEGEYGKKFVSVVGKNDAVEGKDLRIFDITTSKKFPTMWAALTNPTTYKANTNAAGDGAIVKNTDSTFTIYKLVTNNNITAYRLFKMPIEQAREDKDGDLKPDRLNDTVTVVGVVTGPNYQTTNNSYYIQDGDFGLVTFLSGTKPVLTLGNKIQVTGKISHYNGLTQIQPFDTLSIVKLADSAAVPAPKVLTIPEYIANAEKYESILVQLFTASKKSGVWPAANSSVTIKIYDGVDTTKLVDLRIDSDTDVDGSTEPIWPVSVIGIGSQFSSGGSVSNGYQILPRYAATDFPPALPVQLTSFAASVNGSVVSLSWKTASEDNNFGFHVERSKDGVNFESVSFIKGNGTTTLPQVYAFTEKVAAGSYSYRLKQVDFNGSFEYSNIINVDVTAPKVYSLNQNYPNPFNPSTTLSFNLPVDAKVSVKIFDALGRELMNVVNGDLTQGNHNYNVNLSGLSSGIYFYSIEANGVDGSRFNTTKKMSLMK